MTEQRELRAITQRILLLNVDCTSELSLSVNILGASNKEYIIYLTKETDDTVKFECTCPDFKIRHQICKHLYWFGHKQMYNTHPSNWNCYLFNKLYTYYNTAKLLQEHGRNNICGICLESIDYNIENAVCCTLGCKNSVHTICWYRLLSTTHMNRCIYCREWMLV